MNCTKPNIVLVNDNLIGGDYYWEFMSDEVVRGESGPVAILIKLGFVLSGQSGNACYLAHFIIGLKEIKKIFTMRLF